MTNYFNLLVEVINSLRDKGMSKQAAELDKILCKNAQELGAPSGDPLADLELADLMSIEEQAAPEMGNNEQFSHQPGSAAVGKSDLSQRTLFYQFEKWHSVLDRELPKFDYFGENNISAIRSAAANVHRMLEHAFHNKTREYDKEAVENWNSKVDEIVRRIQDSEKAKITSTKAIVDAHLFYDTTNRLYERFKRVCSGDPVFSEAMQEFGSLIHTFTNVIKSTSEQISGTDLTRVP